jgi:hypothetical protein
LDRGNCNNSDLIVPKAKRDVEDRIGESQPFPERNFTLLITSDHAITSVYKLPTSILRFFVNHWFPTHPLFSSFAAQNHTRL